MTDQKEEPGRALQTQTSASFSAMSDADLFNAELEKFLNDAQKS